MLGDISGAFTLFRGVLLHHFFSFLLHHHFGWCLFLFFVVCVFLGGRKLDEKENWEVGDACFLVNYFAVRKNGTGTSSGDQMARLLTLHILFIYHSANSKSSRVSISTL